MTGIHRIGMALGMTIVLTAAQGRADDETIFSRAPWMGGAGIGHIQFEGDEAVESGQTLSVWLAHHPNPDWTVEGRLDLAPGLDFRQGNGDTWNLRLGVGGLYHLRTLANVRWDPYLSLGGEWLQYDSRRNEDDADVSCYAGGGLFYHFDEEWALRVDVRPMVTLSNNEFNALFTIGMNWRWGARIPPQYRLEGEDLHGIDSDGDGLTDWDELHTYGTDPQNPDTDEDGLTDYEEIYMYATDPLGADTDYDGLADGAELRMYGTDPLDPDTDKGGVRDGHEVIEDGTDPLDPSDDLLLVTLKIEFDYDKAEIRPQYFEELEKVVRVLQRNPSVTARIEGHADRRPRSSRLYNLRLSEQRARAVVDYLVQTGNIDSSRLTHHGYGFDRPIAPNDTEENMQRNRRTEVYFRSENPEGDLR